MKYDDLLEIIKIGEGYTIELKERVSDSIAKDICAFANGSGGKIILGVTDKAKEIKGFELTNEVKSKIQSYARNIDPSIIVDMEQVKDIAVIYVPEGKEKPYFVNGRCYLRQGASSQQLTRDEIRSFFQRTNLIRFDRKLNTDFSFKEDFNNKVFEKFVSESGIDKSLSKEHILKNINLLEDKRLTNAGVLFFAKTVKKYFPNSVITAVLYQGYERIEILDRQDFEEDFITNLEGIIKFLLRNLRVRSIIKGLKRYDIPEFRKEILREIVLNAMVHRDYWSEGRILVEIFKDRLEISNPGSLLFDKKYLGQISITRNPILADLVHRIGLVERVGSGINKIKKTLGDRIKFSEEDNWFRVVIEREEKNLGQVTQQVPRKHPASTPQDERVINILNFCKEPKKREDIQLFTGIKDREYFRSKILKPLIESELLQMTIPDKPNSPNQKYVITKKGKKLLENLGVKN